MRDPESPIILTHGEWVRHGAIRIWRPREIEVLAEPEQPTAPRRPRAVPMIACPVCFARTNERCRTTDGRPAHNSHKARLAGRSCVCGEPRMKRSDQCATCRACPDVSVVERLLDGEHVDSTPAEKTEALRRWLETGGSERAFCRMHGWKHGRYTPKREREAA